MQFNEFSEHYGNTERETHTQAEKAVPDDGGGSSGVRASFFIVSVSRSFSTLNILTDDKSLNGELPPRQAGRVGGLCCCCLGVYLLVNWMSLFTTTLSTEATHHPDRWGLGWITFRELGC